MSVLGALFVAALGSNVNGALGQTIKANSPGLAAVGSPASDEIVQRLVQRNQQRADQLKGYSEERKYTVTYRGFPASITASMAVMATYDAPSTKHFRILSQNGSKLLVNRVLRKLLDSEKEAAHYPDRTALTTANYSFFLLGTQVVMGRQCYVVHVQPKVNSKFLYRGKIYVDAHDYAVVQIDAEPAKSPSFWIKETHIHHVYAKSGEFWLPERDRSESVLRLGGSAVLTIEYGPYRIQSADGP